MRRSKGRREKGEGEDDTYHSLYLLPLISVEVARLASG